MNATELQHVNHRRRRSVNQPNLHCHGTPRMFPLVSTVLRLCLGSVGRVHKRKVSFHVGGVVISFWTTYGTRHIDGETSFRVPFGLQMVSSALLGLGILAFPYSPRWLALASLGSLSIVLMIYSRQVSSAGLESASNTHATVSLPSKAKARHTLSFREFVTVPEGQ